ncbi:MAG: biotin/lipoyl-containing protein, partial [Pseudomonadota bacterium]
ATMEGLIDDEPFALRIADKTEGYLVRYRGVSAIVNVFTPRAAELHARLPEKEAPDTSKMVLSPMPGLVVSMDVEMGQSVKSGEAVCIVEAMKMQNIIRASADGVVKTINAGAGDSVAADEVLVEFE